MPFGIRKSGDSYKVINKHTGRVLGTHPSKAKANSQLAAININYYKEETDGEENKFINPINLPHAGIMVDGLLVGSDVPNKDSIISSFNDGEITILKGIREVPLSLFDPVHFYAKNDQEHTKELAKRIEYNKYINPLIIVFDKEGAYVLEGGHRLAALQLLGKKTLPALIIQELDTIKESHKEISQELVSNFANALEKSLDLKSLYLIYYPNRNILKLDTIIVKKENRGQGSGSKALQEITAFADEHGLKMILTLGQQDPHMGTTSSERLRKFYSQFGFVKNKDLSITASMVREPKMKITETTNYTDLPIMKKIPRKECDFACPHCGEVMREKDYSFKYIGKGTDNIWTHKCDESKPFLMPSSNRLDESVNTNKSGISKKETEPATKQDTDKVNEIINDKSLPETAEDGKAYVVHWADGRGIFACSKKSYLLKWLKDTGSWAEIVSIKYQKPEHKGTKLKIVNESIKYILRDIFFS